jgi:iron complex outermembrane receptor protein
MVVDVDLIERVEIIRGPGHTLYGANAMMGVINVITRGEGNGRRGGVGATGSFDTYKGRVSYGKKFTLRPGDAPFRDLLHSGDRTSTFRNSTLPPPASVARGCDRERGAAHS